MYIWWAGGSLSFVSMPHWTNNSSSIKLPFRSHIRLFGGGGMTVSFISACSCFAYFSFRNKKSIQVSTIQELKKIDWLI